MSKQIIDNVNVIVCDWKDGEGNSCDLGMGGVPKAFINPDPRVGTDSYYQCGEHHGVVKQEDKPEYQLPDDHELKENTLLQDENLDLDKDVAVKMDGFIPDAQGKIWDGDKDSVVWDKERE